MPSVEQKTVLIRPLGPGRAKVIIHGFRAATHLGDNWKHQIKLLFTRSNGEKPKNWPADAPDGFTYMAPLNPAQHSLTCEFELSQAVVNVLAYDAANDYHLHLTYADGGNHCFWTRVEGRLQANANAKITEHAQSSLHASNHGRRADTFNPAAGTNVNSMSSLQAATGIPNQAPQSAIPNTPPPAENTGKGSKLGKILLILLLLCAIGGGVAWYMGLFDKFLASDVSEQVVDEPSNKDEAVDKDEPVQADNDSADNHAADAALDVLEDIDEDQVSVQAKCSIGDGSLSDQEILNNCFSSQPSEAELNQLLKESLQGARCEIALKMLSHFGRSTGGGKYAYVFALMSDPRVRGSAQCVTKHAETASYWYDQAKKDPYFDRNKAIELANFLVSK